MSGLNGGIKKARFYVSVSAIYALTLLFALTAFDVSLFRKKPDLVYAAPVAPISITEAVVVTAGKPTKVELPRLGINLPIEDGVYDTANKTWTLTGTKAHFALPSVVANDYQGTTLIYGHNNKDVFAKAKQLVAGDSLQLKTDNAHTFTYSFERAADVQPNDSSVFKSDGPPTLVIQTCSGSWNEIRTLYYFKFVKVTG